MAAELAPRFQLVAVTRTILIFFSIFALINAYVYIGTMYNFTAVRAAFATSWAAVAWNIISVAAATLHPQMQRFADSLPFDINITIHGYTILSYGENSGNGERSDGLLTSLASKVAGFFIDALLATLILVFLILSRDKAVECWGCVGGYYHVERWTLNIWWTLLGFEYALALVQALEATVIWYKRHRLNKTGHISLR